MAGDTDLLAVMRAISDDDRATAEQLLAATPELSTALLTTGSTRATSEGLFLDQLRMQLYSGDTALHVAAAAYDAELAGTLLEAGADVRARNRRGVEPLHAATRGGPGSSSWQPNRQAEIIRYLIEAGGDPNATAAGGVTPLLRAVRNRCSSAVRVLLDAGADPARPNDNGSSALDLARLTTGRGGTGSPEAKAEQATIIAMLEATSAR